MEVLDVLEEVVTWRLGRDGYLNMLVKIGEKWRVLKMLTIWSEL